MYVRMLILGLLISGQPAFRAIADGVVYTWVDEQGVTHFSDAPPAWAKGNDSDTTEVDTIAMPQGFPAAVDPEEDYFSITNQWKRMQEELLERERLALQREQLEIERNRARQAIGETDTAISGTPAAVSGGRHRHHAVLLPIVSGHHGPGHRRFNRHGVHPPFSPHRPHHRLKKTGSFEFFPYKVSRPAGVRAAEQPHRGAGVTRAPRNGRPLNSQ